MKLYKNSIKNLFLFFYKAKSNTFGRYYVTIMNHLNQNTKAPISFSTKGTTIIFGTTTNITTLWGC